MPILTKQIYTITFSGVKIIPLSPDRYDNSTLYHVGVPVSDVPLPIEYIAQVVGSSISDILTHPGNSL